MKQSCRTNALVVQAVWQAKEFRPDGIKAAGDYRSLITVDETASAITWPYSMLNEVLRGLRKQELVTVCAGSGTGKTTFCKELVHHLLLNDQKVGLIALEESNKRSLLGLVGIHLSKNLLVDRTQATDDEVLSLLDDLFGTAAAICSPFWVNRYQPDSSTYGTWRERWMLITSSSTISPSLCAGRR